jgi:hypothetical protein
MLAVFVWLIFYPIKRYNKSYGSRKSAGVEKVEKMALG